MILENRALIAIRFSDRKSKNFGKLVKNRCESPNSLLEIPSILVDVLAVLDL